MKNQFAKELKAMIEGEILKQKHEEKLKDKQNKETKRFQQIQNENKVLDEAVKEAKHAQMAAKLKN